MNKYLTILIISLVSFQDLSLCDTTPRKQEQVKTPPLKKYLPSIKSVRPRIADPALVREESKANELVLFRNFNCKEKETPSESALTPSPLAPSEQTAGESPLQIAKDVIRNLSTNCRTKGSEKPVEVNMSVSSSAESFPLSPNSSGSRSEFLDSLGASWGLGFTF
jgi:hypothetical protein